MCSIHRGIGVPTEPNRLSRQIEACGVRAAPKTLPPERRSGRRGWNLGASASTVQMGTQYIRGSADVNTLGGRVSCQIRRRLWLGVQSHDTAVTLLRFGPSHPGQCCRFFGLSSSPVPYSWLGHVLSAENSLRFYNFTAQKLILKIVNG